MAESDAGKGRRAMGALESEVLAALWSLGRPATPAEVHTSLDGLAYSTVVTILTRLFVKGLLERSRCGRAFAYRPVVSEAELAAQRMQTTLSAAGDRRAALASFLGGLRGDDESALRELMAELGSVEDDR